MSEAGADIFTPSNKTCRFLDHFRGSWEQWNRIPEIRLSTKAQAVAQFVVGVFGRLTMPGFTGSAEHQNYLEIWFKKTYSYFTDLPPDQLKQNIWK